MENTYIFWTHTYTVIHSEIQHTCKHSHMTAILSQIQCFYFMHTHTHSHSSKEVERLNVVMNYTYRCKDSVGSTPILSRYRQQHGQEVKVLRYHPWNYATTLKHRKKVLVKEDFSWKFILTWALILTCRSILPEFFRIQPWGTIQKIPLITLIFWIVPWGCIQKTLVRYSSLYDQTINI